ncbi:hypothetical protein D3C81_1684990 [compost metagenome]
MNFKGLVHNRQTEYRVLNKCSQFQLILYPLIPFLMPILLPLQTECKPDAGHQFHLVYRFRNIINSTCIKSFRQFLGISYCGNHNNRNVPQIFILLDYPASLDTIHLRHHHIQ